MLERAVNVAQYLQGIGSGGAVSSSGEEAVFAKLQDGVDSNHEFCVFDVGANAGQYLALASACLAGRRFRLHSFEPGGHTYEQLRQNAQGVPNTVLNHCGLGRVCAERELFYDLAGSGLASLTKRRLQHFGNEAKLSEQVHISTLDDYCHEHSVDYIDLLKIDVEGHEMDVLEGGHRMFSQSAIGMVTFEFGGCNIDTRTFFQDFFYFFRENRMRIARITPAGYLHELGSYKEAYEQFRTTNYLCYRP